MVSSPSVFTIKGGMGREAQLFTNTLLTYSLTNVMCPTAHLWDDLYASSLFLLHPEICSHVLEEADPRGIMPLKMLQI